MPAPPGKKRVRCPACGQIAEIEGFAGACACGKKLVLKKPAPPPPEDDLKIVELPPSEAPAVPATAPPVYERPPRRRARVLSSGGGGRATIGGALGVIALAVFVGLKVCRTAQRISGQTVTDETITVGADDSYGGGLEVDGTFTYNFDVSPLDGSVTMVFGRVADPDQITEGELLQLLSSGKEVAPGSSGNMSGRINSGKYLWSVINGSEDKPVRVKVKFHAKE